MSTITLRDTTVNDKKSYTKMDKENSQKRNKKGDRGLSEASFGRLVCEIVQDESENDLIVSGDAKRLLQVVSERYLTNFFRKVGSLADNAGRKSVRKQDIDTLAELETMQVSLADSPYLEDN